MTSSLSIIEIKSPGDLAHERVVVRVLEDINVGNYLLFSAIANDKGVYAGPGVGFWLPNLTVKQEDTVVIYTKKGDAKEKELGGGRKSHFIYLNRTTPIWNDDKRAAVLFCVGDVWSKYKVGGFSDDADTEPA